VQTWRSEAANWWDPKDALPEWPEGKRPQAWIMSHPIKRRELTSAAEFLVEIARPRAENHG